MTYYTEQEQETPATLVPTGSPMRKKVKETLPASVDELRRELSEMKISLQQQQQCAARTATRVAELEDQLYAQLRQGSAPETLTGGLTSDVETKAQKVCQAGSPSTPFSTPAGQNADSYESGTCGESGDGTENAVSAWLVDGTLSPEDMSFSMGTSPQKTEEASVKSRKKPKSKRR